MIGKICAHKTSVWIGDTWKMVFLKFNWQQKGQVNLVSDCKEEKLIEKSSRPTLSLSLSRALSLSTLSAESGIITMIISEPVFEVVGGLRRGSTLEIATALKQRNTFKLWMMYKFFHEDRFLSENLFSQRTSC